MTLCEIVEKHGLPVTVVSEDPLFGGVVMTLLAEEKMGFWYEQSHVVSAGHSWIGKNELKDSWVLSEIPPNHPVVG